MNMKSKEVPETEMRAALRAFVTDNKSLRELEQQLGSFNVFGVLRNAHNELHHSNMLSWLLDPAGNHGMSDHFLRRWLMAVYAAVEAQDDELVSEMKIDPVDIDTTPFQNVRVFREWNYIDLVVQIKTADKAEWVVAIENKVNSQQGVEQLSGHKKVIKRGFPKAEKIVLLFLTRHPEAPRDPSFLPVSYSTVIKALESVVESAGILPPGPEFLLQQYLTILNNNFMANSENAKLAVRIYNQHKAALDFIFNHRPDVVSNATELIVQKLKDHGDKEGLTYLAHTRGGIWFVPALWDCPSNCVHEQWAKALFLIKLFDEKDTSLAAVLTPSLIDMEERKKVWQLSTQEKYVNVSSKYKVGPKWFTFYKEKLPGVNFEESDPITLAEDVWEKFIAKLETSEYKKVRDTMVPILHAFPETRMEGDTGEMPDGVIGG